ncbi:MAG: hypothetical protein EP329_15235 [Deltaproteobacteria bacterium]|nr:MAG: hypothetical protein EP329_15235 [Deltaproteobacteria bacterium]
MDPVLTYDRIVSAWRCHMRGHCCRGHRIGVDGVTYRRMHQTLLVAADPRAAAFDPDAPPDEDGWRGVPMTGPEDQGACLFLTEDQRCGWRMAHGTSGLPSICSRYPYLQLYTPERLRVGLTFTCPTALGLLADQVALDVVEEPDGEPPVEYVTNLGGFDRRFYDTDGGRLRADLFWRRHDALAAAFDRGDTLAKRLASLVAEAGVPPVAPVAVPDGAWAHGAFSGELLGQLGERGAVTAGVMGLWSESVYRPMPDAPDFSGSEDALLARYLAHRLLVPAFYSTRTDLAWLLGVLFLAVARYRVERARGATPMFALRHVELLVLHSGMPVRALLGDDPARTWRPIAALALAP